MISEKKIVVTGAGGLIGDALCNLLYKHHFPFIALYRDKPEEENDWHKEYCNLENPDSVNCGFWGKTSCVIHCAAAIPSSVISSESCYDINKQIDKNIYHAIQKASVPMMVFLSSSSVYGFSDNEINEDSQVSPQTIYSIGKLESESMFRSLKNCKTIFLRINAPYDFKQKSRTVLKIFIENALNNKPLVYHGSGLRAQDFTAVEDIVNAIFLIISLGIKTSGEVYNIASGKSISMRDLAQLIVSLIPHTQSTIEPSGIPDPQEECRSNFSIKKIFRDYSWSPKVSLEQGIKNWIALINT